MPDEEYDINLYFILNGKKVIKPENIRNLSGDLLAIKAGENYIIVWGDKAAIAKINGNISVALSTSSNTVFYLDEENINVFKDFSKYSNNSLYYFRSPVGPEMGICFNNYLFPKLGLGIRVTFVENIPEIILDTKILLVGNKRSLGNVFICGGPGMNFENNLFVYNLGIGLGLGLGPLRIVGEYYLPRSSAYSESINVGLGFKL
jgi:hypothetical protein